jgi:hypothetical protein
MRGYLNIAFPVAAGIVVAAGLTPAALHLTALTLVALVVLVVAEMPNLERDAASHGA